MVSGNNYRIHQIDVEIELSCIGFLTFTEVVLVIDGKATEVEFKMISDITRLEVCGHE